MIETHTTSLASPLHIKFFSHGPFLFGLPESWGRWCSKKNTSGMQRARLATVMTHPTPKTTGPERGRFSTAHCATRGLT